MLLRHPHDLAGVFRDGRARAGWSQTELAERVGVSRQWISMVENGKTSVEFDLVVGALQALGCRLYVDSSDAPPSRSEHGQRLQTPVHSLSQRTPLTRHGEPLDRRRPRRRPRGGDEENLRG